MNAAVERKLSVPDAVRAVNPRDRTIEAVISAEVIDREGDCLRSRGVDTREYLANPVVLDHHRMMDLPIGRTLALDVGDAEVVALIQWADHPRALAIEQLYVQKMMRGWSVGFSPTKVSPTPLITGPLRGREILAWTLWEVSAVSLPANPLALARMLKSLSLPDGATEGDVLEVMGALPAQKFWDLSRSHLKEDDMPDTPTELEQARAETKAATERAALAESRLAVLERARGGGGDDDREQLYVGGQPWPPGTGKSKSVRIPPPFAREAPGVIHSRGEQSYSVTRAVLSVLRRDKSMAPFEWDLSQKLERCGYPTVNNGINIPWSSDAFILTEGHEPELEALGVLIKQSFAMNTKGLDRDEFTSLARKAMSEDSDLTGGSLVPMPSQGELLPMLRAASIISRAGARNVPLPASGAMTFPAERSGPTFAYFGPNSPIGDSTPGTGSVSLAARRAGALIYLPNSLARYSSGVAEAFVRSALALGAATFEDGIALDGVGGSNSPLGLVRHERSANNTPTVGKVTLHTAAVTGASGDTFGASDPAVMLALIEEANSEGATAIVMRPLMFSGIANLRGGGSTTTDGPFLFPITTGDLARGIPDTLRGVSVLKSTTVAKTGIKGSSGPTLTYVLVGDFRQYFVGRTGALEIASSEHAAFASDQLVVRGILSHDLAPAHPECFAVCPTLIIPS